MKIGLGNSGMTSDYAAQRGLEGAAPVVQTPQASAQPEAKIESPKKDEDPNHASAFSEEWMKRSVDQANKALAMHDRFIERDVHPVTHTIMYKIMDTKTKEVIAEYPPKKIQDMVAKMWELAGLFVDEKA